MEPRLTRAVHGLLLTNLGTPDAPDPASVRRYLGEFLWDKHVLDINPVGRWLLLHGIILRTRPKKSAHAYQTIWTEAGSPLMTHSKALTSAVAAALGPEWKVALGMRYGSPSLEAGLDALLGDASVRVTDVTVLPLYPQYATSSTLSTLERVRELVQARRSKGALAADVKVHEVQDFFADRGFVEAQAELAREALAGFGADKVMMSFHGLPERHLTRLDPKCGTSEAHCLVKADCCAAVDARNALCYRAQAHETARQLAASLQIPSDRYEVAFQSRLGRIPWIRPYTDERMAELPKQGVKRLAVLCPSFTADCLETLEEIHIRAKDDFLAAGGEAFLAIPCVNSHPRWVQAVADLARGAAG